MTLFLPGDWKAARTRRQECPRYVARTFLSAGSGDFPVPGSWSPSDAKLASKRDCLLRRIGTIIDAHFAEIKNVQKGSLDITGWIEWYLNCLKRAINASDKLLETILAKDRFWKLHKGESFNERQRKVINRLLDGFGGKLTSSKWGKLTKSSHDTALRDISDLLERKILAREQAGGRSTSYVLKLPENN